jgi:ATP-binding cassette subfamily B protein
MVSQRATSIKDMDRIYVLEQGRVAKVGKHEELLSSCSIYKEIYEMQVAVK